MAKVGILYICTGKYTVFWPDFYRTFREKFLPESDKTFFVFTDAPSIEGDGAPDVRRIYQKALDWPYSSLLRFKMFAGQAAALRPPAVPVHDDSYMAGEPAEVHLRLPLCRLSFE